MGITGDTDCSNTNQNAQNIFAICTCNLIKITNVHNTVLCRVSPAFSRAHKFVVFQRVSLFAGQAWKVRASSRGVWGLVSLENF